MDKNRITAILILGKFDKLLAKHNIIIPDDNRIGDEDEAPIYGATRYELEDEITNLLNKQEREVF